MEIKGKNGNEKKGRVARMPKRRYAYFRDNQIMFLVTHPDAELSSDQLENLGKRIQEYLGGATISWLASQIFSFPKVTEYELKQQAVIIEQIKNELGDKYNPSDYEPDPGLSANFFSTVVGNLANENVEGLEPTELIEVIKSLRDNIKNLADEDVIVKSASPNWLMSAASEGGATGGPGGLPQPFKGREEEAQYQFDSLIAKLGDLNGKGRNVDVAILDTAPCPHDLVFAPKEWPSNPLIKSLLGTSGRLHLYPASYDQLRRMRNTSVNRHDYKMTDHGLFAAGIIHSIVPEATIHLIEVLNPFGVGDFLSLVDGLKRVLTDIYKPDKPNEPGRKLVVNCSWMLELPLVDGHCYADESDMSKYPKDTAEDVEFEMEVLRLAESDQQVVLELKELCKRLFCIGRQVVGAAGNDWENGKARKERKGSPPSMPIKKEREEAPAARYPAAFAAALGVGALPKDSQPDASTGKYKASKYSNLGDKPARTGIMTFGGEEGKGNGVLGLYLEEKFPERVPNGVNKNEIRMIERKEDEMNHWAWWAGTSFATPILTGTIAAVLSSLVEPANMNTQEAVRELYSRHIIENAQTDAKEDVMVVTQGSQPQPR